MFDVPVDSTYVWFGVGAVSLAVFGVAVGLPNAAPPDATATANAVDAVAVGPPGAVGTYDLPAVDRLRLGSNQIGLENDGGRAHATFAYSVTPAVTNDRLERVLDGERPRSAFDSPSAFADAATAAREHEPDWRPAPDRLTARRVAWRDVNVTLVG